MATKQPSTTESKQATPAESFNDEATLQPAVEASNTETEKDTAGPVIRSTEPPAPVLLEGVRAPHLMWYCTVADLLPPRNVLLSSSLLCFYAFCSLHWTRSVIRKLMTDIATPQLTMCFFNPFSDHPGHGFTSYRFRLQSFPTSRLGFGFVCAHPGLSPS